MPVNSQARHLPKRWQAKLRAEMKKRHGKRSGFPMPEFWDQPVASDFGSASGVALYLGDAMLTFLHAFAIVERKWSEVLVVTEHLGYHLFPIDSDDAWVKQYSGENVPGTW